MSQCLSCKNRYTTERCSSPCLRTMIVCKRHAKCKRPRFWFEANDGVMNSVINIQRIWRGFMTRNRIVLAGPGVLKRSLCNNEDEVITCIHKSKQHPFDYFSFEEDEKVYWFDQRTMAQWAHQNQRVMNPYTRQAIPIEALARLRELLYIRSKVKVPIYHSSSVIPTTLVDRRDLRWLRICQILQEHHFGFLRNEHFTSFGMGQLGSFVNFLREDMRWWSARVEQGRRKKYYFWLSAFRQWSYDDEIRMSCDLSGILLAMLMDYKHNHELCSFICDAHRRADLLWDDI